MRFPTSFIISFFCISILAKDIGHAEIDTYSCMRQIVCDRLAFKEKAVGAVFDKFKEKGISQIVITEHHVVA